MQGKHTTLLEVAFCAFMFAAAFGLLLFGVIAYVAAPSNPGQGFWTLERLIGGVLPVCLSVALFAWTSRRWFRAYGKRWNAVVVAAVGAIVLLVAAIFDCVLYWKLRAKPDAGINVSWDSESGTFHWGKGQVKLPLGFSYTRLEGIDSTVGRFTAADGAIVIRHDIGELGGGLPDTPVSETATLGSRVQFGRSVRLDEVGRTRFLFEVSFPDSGCAKFWLEAPDESGSIVIASLANSFQPTIGPPAWVRPLLPEVLRSDCRLVPNPRAQFRW